jgi:hypothetical protein
MTKGDVTRHHDEGDVTEVRAIRQDDKSDVM